MNSYSKIGNAISWIANTFILLIIATALPVWADEDKFAGKTIGEWAAKWWQWESATNDSDDGRGPFDEGEIDCSRGQQGPVWFLAGEVERDCCDSDNPPGSKVAYRECRYPIPAGKRLFFPLLNARITNPDSWCPPEDSDDGNDNNNICTVEEKRALLDSALSDFLPGPVNSRTCRLSVFVDETPVIYDGTLIVRTQSPTFSYGGDPESVDDGYYVMLPKLPKGEHTIDFTGGICAFDGNANPNESKNVILSLTVEYKLEIK